VACRVNCYCCIVKLDLVTGSHYTGAAWPPPKGEVDIEGGGGCQFWEGGFETGNMVGVGVGDASEGALVEVGTNVWVEEEKMAACLHCGIVGVDNAECGGHERHITAPHCG